MLVLLFVALWFILWGDLLYVFPCVILFLCFLVLLVLRLPCLGKRELILVLFVGLFDLCLFGFVGLLFLLGSGKGCGLWMWHSLDFSLTFFCLISMYWYNVWLLWYIRFLTNMYIKYVQCSSNILRSSGSRVRYRDINGARYKSRHVPCMYNGVHNTRSVCRCGSLLRHHG